MGIKLDWNVESEGGWSEIGEDRAILEARHRRSRQMRTVGLVLVAIFAIIAGGTGWRLYSVGRQLRADLNATIKAETAALRIGDRDSYLFIQSDLEEWQRLQAVTFEDYQGLGERVEITGDVVDIEITADRARAVVQENLDGKPYHVIWFYQHTADGWRHVPPSAGFWGEQESAQTVYFNFTYHEHDQPLVDDLSARLNDWWRQACRAADNCPDAPHGPTIRIEPDPLARLGWAAYSENTLIIPSPSLGRMPAEGGYDPVLYEQLAVLLSERWAERVVAAYLDDSPDPYSDEEWVQIELTAYIHHQFNEAAPPSGFFEPLAHHYGEDDVAAFLEALPTIRRIDTILPVLEEITGESAAELPIDWSSYLAQRLRAETHLVATGFMTEAVLLYRDVERPPSIEVVDIATETLAQPDSITVLGTHRTGEIAWAEVQFTTVSDPDGKQQLTFEPFRLVDGRWVHSWPQLSDWGEVTTITNAHLTLHYYELDVAAVEGLLPALEQAYMQAAVDLGVEMDTLPPVEVAITPYTGFSTMIMPRRRPQIAPTIQVIVPSPYAMMRPHGVSAGEHLRHVILRDVVTSLLTNELGRENPLSNPLTAGILTWELEQHGVDPGVMVEAYLAQNGQISQPWPADGNGSLAFMPPYTDEHYQQARALIDVVVAQYGSEAIPSLIDNWPQSGNVDDWLMRSLGISFADVRAEWEAKLEE